MIVHETDSFLIKIISCLVSAVKAKPDSGSVCAFNPGANWTVVALVSVLVVSLPQPVSQEQAPC